MGAIGFGAALGVGQVGRASKFDFSRRRLPPGARLTRGSGASVYDPAGVLVSVAADVARFDHDPVTLASRGLLIEPAGSNTLSWSSDWTNAYWIKNNVAAVAAGVLIETTASGGHSARQATGDIAFVAGQPVTLSTIASERSGSAKRYLLFSIGTTPVFADATLAFFDLASGVITAASNVIAAGAVPVGTGAAGGGAWLCWVTVTPVATAGSGQTIVFRLSGTPTVANSYVGDGTSGFNISHIQVEPGTIASSRIVTTGAPGIRAADALVLDWRSLGVPDGTIMVRYQFDDGSTQDVATTVTGGSAVVPVTLARRWILRARKV